MQRSPSAYFSSALCQEALQAVLQRHLQHTKHGLSAQHAIFFRGSGHCNICPLVLQGLHQTLSQIQRKHGRVTRHGQQVGVWAVRHAHQEARQGPCKVGLRIGPHIKTQSLVVGQMPIGIDADGIKGQALGLQAPDRMLHQALPLQQLQTFVHAVHA